jgi:hypothetical protein
MINIIKLATTLFAILFLAFIGISILGIVMTGDIMYVVPIIISIVGLFMMALIWDFTR